jgi:hypothetical protein
MLLSFAYVAFSAVLRTHYNCERPHRELALVPPEAISRGDRPAAAAIERHDLLGGLIHETEPPHEPGF